VHDAIDQMVFDDPMQAVGIREVADLDRAIRGIGWQEPIETDNLPSLGNEPA
jgi:hypothetical protein